MDVEKTGPFAKWTLSSQNLKINISTASNVEGFLFPVKKLFFQDLIRDLLINLK